MTTLNPAVVNADEILRRLRLNIGGADIGPGPDPDYPYYVVAPGDTDVRPEGLSYVSGTLVLTNSNGATVSLTLPLGVAGMSLAGSVLTVVNTDGTQRTVDLAGVTTLALAQLLAQVPPVVDETGNPYERNGNDEQVIPRQALHIDDTTLIMDVNDNVSVAPVFDPIGSSAAATASAIAAAGTDATAKATTAQAAAIAAAAIDATTKADAAAAASVPLTAYTGANVLLVASGASTPAALTPGASTFVGRKATGGVVAMSVAEVRAILDDRLVIQVEADATTITTSSTIMTFAPFDMTITGVWTGATTQSTSGVITSDLKKNGTTMLSTLPSIDANEYTSLTGTAAVVSVATVSKGDRLSSHVTAAGTGAKGLWMVIEYIRTA